VCRAVFEIPAASTEEVDEDNQDGASPPPVNHFVSTVLAAASTSTSVDKNHADPNAVVCEICEENEAHDCKECSQSFCDTCKRFHLKTKMSAHHQFISLDEAMKPGSGGGGGSVSRIARCEKHPHLEINTFCHTDQQTVCAECAVDFHKGHEVDKLSNVSPRFKEEI